MDLLSVPATSTLADPSMISIFTPLMTALHPVQLIRSLQIVLTASAGGYAYQNSIYIYSSTSVYLAPEVWNIALNTLIFNPTSTAISGIIGTTNSLELKIFSSSGTYYVGFYLNGTLYQRYTSGSSGTATAFDDEMTPSIVFESADPYSTDFNGIWNYGFFYGNGNMLPMNLYLGWWGYCNGITSIQTTTSYVGQNVEAFNNVAVSGYNNGFQSAYQAAFFIGDISGGNKKFGMYMNGLSDSLASLEISWYYDSNPSWFRIGN